ncbi:MAG: FUSC family protein [Reyranellaceae bacterium]
MTNKAVAHLGTLVTIDLSRWSLEQGMRAALACCVPLLIAEWTGESILSWAALIGFWVSLVDPGWPTRARLQSIGGFIGAAAVACFIGVLLRSHLWASGAFALLWCTLAILTRVWGSTSGSAGNYSALALIIVLGDSEPSSLHAAAMVAAVTGAGGLWGLLLAFCIGRHPPDTLLRGALAAVFRSEAAFVRDMLGDDPTHRQRRGTIREAVETARDMLVAARRGWLGDVAAIQRFALVLGDAEEVLKALLGAREILEEMPTAQMPHAALADLATKLDGIAAVLTERNGGSPPAAITAAPATTVVALHHAMAWTQAASEHLAGRVGLGTPTVTTIEATPIGWLGQLRANLTFDSLSMRHALRFGLTGAVLTLLTKGLHLEMGHWISLTAVIILQAYPSATWQKAIERVLGTLLGGLIATAAVYVLQGPAAVLLVVAPLSLLAMASRPASYALYIVCITPMFILITELFSNGGVLSPELSGLRMIDNVIGAAAGMLATFVLWPSWESRYLRRRLADDLRANGSFLLTALDGWRGAATPQQTEVARRQAGLAGNNAEASIRRAVDEPHRRSADEIAAAMLITAASRRLTGIAAAIMHGARGGGSDGDMTEKRRVLQATLKEVADAIEQSRRPTSAPYKPPDTTQAGEIELLLARACRQLGIAQEAAVRLAAGH